MKIYKQRLGQTYDTLLSQGLKGSLAKLSVSFGVIGMNRYCCKNLLHLYNYSGKGYQRLADWKDRHF
jgi:DNA-directed RNA polymerase subunit N (RpoN/RPB10)